MQKKPEHTRLLNNAAKNILGPMGMKKHESRLWIDDHTWWLILVEFQPSSWAKGTYLNVGCCWLLYPKTFLSFNDGYRQHPFIQYEDPTQFGAVAQKLCLVAAEKVEEYRTMISSINDVYLRIASKIDSKGRRKYSFWERLQHGLLVRNNRVDLWSTYYFAVLAGLLRKEDEADALFRVLLAAETRPGWTTDIKLTAKKCNEVLHDMPAYELLVSSFVNQSRSNLKLGEVEKPFSL